MIRMGKSIRHKLVINKLIYKSLWINALIDPEESSIYEPPYEISNNVVCANSKASDQPAPRRSLFRDFASRLNILCLLSYWPNSI